MRVTRRCSTRWGHPYHLQGACTECRQTLLHPLCSITPMTPEGYTEHSAQSKREDTPDVLLREPRGQDAGVWRPRAEGLGRLPLPAGWPGPAAGVDAWDLVLGRARRPGLRRYLGPPGEQGPPGGGELSASHPHGPGDVPPARVPACGGRVARVPA